MEKKGEAATERLQHNENIGGKICRKNDSLNISTEISLLSNFDVSQKFIDHEFIDNTNARAIEDGNLQPPPAEN